MSTLEQKIARIINIQYQLDLRKELYAELDALTLELQAEGFAALNLDGNHIELVDNFAKGNIAFRPAAVRRFEIEVEPIEKYEKRIAKAAKKAGA